MVGVSVPGTTTPGVSSSARLCDVLVLVEVLSLSLDDALALSLSLTTVEVLSLSLTSVEVLSLSLTAVEIL